ncbi:hypothetical protein [Cryobacterium sp. Y50]|uniref:hypothetical protein n=1 Tax=Cryobacterium sp. Y50 TaxID=2048286 RepID=UPI000CE441F8|nr:hypothetical protein [Cryobacterium sp. Y50]
MSEHRLRAVEDQIAQRIERERTEREWSYEKLAEQMRERAGYTIHPSAIHRVERGSPRRRIVVDEFVAYVRVFQGSVLEWLMDGDERERMQFDRYLRDGSQLHELVEVKRRELADAELQLHDAINEATKRLAAMSDDARADAVDEASELDEDFGEHWTAFRNAVVEHDQK